MGNTATIDHIGKYTHTTGLTTLVNDVFTKFDAANMDKQINHKLDISSRLANAYAWKNRRLHRRRQYREVHRG